FLSASPRYLEVSSEAFVAMLTALLLVEAKMRDCPPVDIDSTATSIAAPYVDLTVSISPWRSPNHTRPWSYTPWRRGTGLHVSSTRSDRSHLAISSALLTVA